MILMQFQKQSWGTPDWSPRRLGEQRAYHEVELLRLLLVGSSLGDAGLTQIGFRDRGLHRLCGAAVLEAFRNIVVLDSDHILYCLQGGLSRFLNLGTGVHLSSEYLISGIPESVKNHCQSEVGTQAFPSKAQSPLWGQQGDQTSPS